jgi:uncharacterized protein YbaP (TraB family)
MKKHLLIFCLLISSVHLYSQKNNTLLWRISQPGSDSVSYVFGTIHLPQERFMHLSDSVYKAVAQSTLFYNEINFLNVTDEMQEISEFSQKTVRRLDSIKHTPSWKRLVTQINRTYNRNIDPTDMESFTRFGQEILQEVYKPDPGVTMVDAALAGLATMLGKPTRGLERYVTQLSMIYRMMDARLEDTTLLFNDDIRLAKDLAVYYERHQLDSIASVIASIHPVYRAIVFDDRNKTMADSIQAITANNTAFFAIGAGHLTGKDGVLNILQSRGLQVQPVHSNHSISITLIEDMFKTGLTNMRKTFARKKDDADDILLAPPPPQEMIEEVKIVEPPKQTKKKKKQ